MYRIYEDVEGGLTPGIQRLEHIPLGKILEEYARGTVCIVVQFDPTAERNLGDFDPVSLSKPRIQIPTHVEGFAPVGIEDLERRMAGGTHDGVDGAMLVGVIKSVEQVKYLSNPFGKGLVSDEKLADPIARCFQLLASKLVLFSGTSAGKLKIAVLRATVIADDVPSHVVEGGSKIVDSIAYYCREWLGDGLNESDLNRWLSTFQILADGKSVRLARYKGFELPFKVRNMMVGPFNF